jgi:hypothetical protein
MARQNHKSEGHEVVAFLSLSDMNGVVRHHAVHCEILSLNEDRVDR